MTDPKILRQRAAQARWAASFRTEGGQAADRQLIALAVRLERDAHDLESKSDKTAPRWASGDRD